MEKRIQKNRNFTLIEMMVVLTIILILVSIGIVVAPLITRQSSEAKTKSLMHAIESAMEQYKNAEGYYPINPMAVDGKYGTQYAPFFLDNYVLSGAEENADSNISNNMMRFFEIEQLKDSRGYNSTAKRYFVMDGFGMPILYMHPGYRMGGGSFDLVSTGANVMPGDVSEEDVPGSKTGGTKGRFLKGTISIEHKDEAKFAAQLGEGDDIANFKAR